MNKYITEILDEINKEPELLGTTYKDNTIVKFIFAYAFDPDLKFKLPKKDPKFKQDPSPMGIAPIFLASRLRKLYVFNREDISEEKRENLFIELLEGLHSSESELLLLIKNQNLKKKYKKITPKLVQQYGFKVD